MSSLPSNTDKRFVGEGFPTNELQAGTPRCNNRGVPRNQIKEKKKMRWLTRLLVAVGLLTAIYLLVAAGRRSAGVRIEIWGQNPQPVCNHQPAGPPSASPPVVLPQAAPPAPSQPLPDADASHIIQPSSVEPTDEDEERAQDYAAAIRRGETPPEQ